MAMKPASNVAATSGEIREILGPVDESVITEVQALGASCDEIREAVAWLGSDDYLHRKLKHTAQGAVAQLIELLEDELQFPEEK
jgi:hypothetical protein